MALPSVVSGTRPVRDGAAAVLLNSHLRSFDLADGLQQPGRPVRGSGSWRLRAAPHRNARSGQSVDHFLRFRESLVEANGAAESWEDRLEAERSQVSAQRVSARPWRRLVSVERETRMLLPVDKRDWVPVKDLGHFVIGAVVSAGDTHPRRPRRSGADASPVIYADTGGDAVDSTVALRDSIGTWRRWPYARP